MKGESPRGVNVLISTLCACSVWERYCWLSPPFEWSQRRQHARDLSGRFRECGLYEASDLLLGDTEKSDTVQWVDVSVPHKRSRRLKGRRERERPCVRSSSMCVWRPPPLSGKVDLPTLQVNGTGRGRGLSLCPLP